MSRQGKKHVQDEQAGVSERSSPPGRGSPVRFPAPEKIAVRAFELWQRRGSPLGSPEVDWFEAERELRRPPGAVFLGR